MNKIITKKILGFMDETQTFLINSKISDSNRYVEIQIVDELTLVDFSDVSSATLHCLNENNADEKCIDISTVNNEISSVTLPLSDFSIGANLCEIVLKDNEDKIILTTNTFVVKVQNLGGDCS